MNNGPPDPQEYRRVVGRFATGIAIVTAVADGVDHAMTVNAFTSVSLDPVLVLFCAEKVARFHDVVLDSETWGVSILGEGSEDISRRLAVRGRPLDGQLDGWRHHRGPHTGVPLFDDALASLECRTHAIHDGGDHSIILGEVLAVATPDPTGKPLLYYEGGYRNLG